MPTFRKATISDIESLISLRLSFINELHKYSLATDISLETDLRSYFSQNIKSNQFIAWLAIENDQIIATSGLTFYLLPPNSKNPSGKVAYIMNMYTLPHFRNKGIANELFKRIIKEAQSLGYTELCLHATEMGIGIYKKYGFIEPHDKELMKYI